MAYTKTYNKIDILMYVIGDWNIPPRKIPPEGATPFVSPPEHSPHEKYAWKQRCLALCEICR